MLGQRALAYTGNGRPSFRHATECAINAFRCMRMEQGDGQRPARYRRRCWLQCDTAGAPLFVCTFARSALPPDMKPVTNETFVFAESAGQPHCFLTKSQLLAELHAAGFAQEPGCPINEYPRQPDSNKPAILEGIFRRAHLVGDHEARRRAYSVTASRLEIRNGTAANPHCSWSQENRLVRSMSRNPRDAGEYRGMVPAGWIRRSANG